MEHLLFGTVLTSQQMKELDMEVSLQQHQYEVLKFCREREKLAYFNKLRSPFSSEALAVVNKMLSFFKKMQEPFNLNQKTKLEVLKKELVKSCGGLGISEVEKREILAAVGLGKGHW